MKIFSGVVGHSLSPHAREFCDFVDYRIAGKNPISSTLIYSTANYGNLTVPPNNYPEDTGAAFVRNVDCWAYDVMDQLTAISVYDGYSVPSSRNKNRMTLITPRHVLAAKHTVGPAGVGPLSALSGAYYPNRPKGWVDMNNNIHSAMPLYWIDLARFRAYPAEASGDACILVLDRDIPSDVSNMSILPYNFPSLITPRDVTRGIPIFKTGQMDELAVMSLLYYGYLFPGVITIPSELPTPFISIPDISFTIPIETIRKQFYTSVLNGDSSCPLMVGYKNNVSFLTTFSSAASGPAYYLAEDTINDAIVALDSLAGYNTGYKVKVSEY